MTGKQGSNHLILTLFMSKNLNSQNLYLYLNTIYIQQTNMDQPSTSNVSHYHISTHKSTTKTHCKNLI